MPDVMEFCKLIIPLSKEGRQRAKRLVELGLDMGEGGDAKEKPDQPQAGHG